MNANATYASQAAGLSPCVQCDANIPCAVLQ